MRRIARPANEKRASRCSAAVRWIAKPFLWLFTGAIPVFIAACYGVYNEFEDLDGGVHTPQRVRGFVKSSASGFGIGGIQVTCFKNPVEVDVTYTLSEDGAFELWYPPGQQCGQLRFEDIDGEENGGSFQAKIAGFDPGLESHNVELDPVQTKEH